jgi:hypothetical protein
MTVGQLAEEVATEMGESYGNPDVALQFERWVSEVTGELWIPRSGSSPSVPIRSTRLLV